MVPGANQLALNEILRRQPCQRLLVDSDGANQLALNEILRRIRQEHIGPVQKR